jgi:hypothetical protein
MRARDRLRPRPARADPVEHRHDEGVEHRRDCRSTVRPAADSTSSGQPHQHAAAARKRMMAGHQFVQHETRAKTSVAGVAPRRAPARATCRPPCRQRPSSIRAGRRVRLLRGSTPSTARCAPRRNPAPSRSRRRAPSRFPA